jgi:hypothetical protein
MRKTNQGLSPPAFAKASARQAEHTEHTEWAGSFSVFNKSRITPVNHVKKVSGVWTGLTELSGMMLTA